MMHLGGEAYHETCRSGFSAGASDTSGLYRFYMLLAAGRSDELLLGLKTLGELFAVALLYCYAISVLGAVPIYILLRQYLQVNLLACMIFGALIGVIVMGPDLLPGDYKEADYEVVARHGHYTAASIRWLMRMGGMAGGFGGAIGTMFWLIAIRNNPVAQRKAVALGMRCHLKPGDGELR